MAHYGSSYFNPHPMSYLAYLAETVGIWCDWTHSRPGFLQDDESVACAEESIRDRVVKKFGADNPAVGDLIRAEYAATSAYCIRKALAAQIEQMSLEKPGRNNRRAETPRHLPLRPHTKIITTMMVVLECRCPGKTKNALRNLCADMLNDGIPAREADGRLTNRSIRSAEDAFYASGKDPLVAVALSRRRIEAWGAPNFWDRNVIEQTLWAVHESGGDAALIEKLYGVDFRWTYEPLRSFGRIYRVARSERRFDGLQGADLARAVNAACGFGRLVERCLDHTALAEAQDEIRTGFANAAA